MAPKRSAERDPPGASVKAGAAARQSFSGARFADFALSRPREAGCVRWRMGAFARRWACADAQRRFSIGERCDGTNACQAEGVGERQGGCGGGAGGGEALIHAAVLKEWGGGLDWA
jgi:hypothetical protein